MLQIETIVCEGCSEFTFTDATGLYDVLTNPSGYGSVNGITSPSDFTTYVLEIRYPSTPVTSPADFTYNLLSSVPPPDDDFHFTWTITKQQLGLTKLKSGVWTFTAIGTLSGVQYIADSQCIFVRDLGALVDEAMLPYDPTCACKDGCENPADLFVEFITIQCGGVCDPDKAQANIDSLYNRLPLCGC